MGLRERSVELGAIERAVGDALSGEMSLTLTAGRARLGRATVEIPAGKTRPLTIKRRP